MPTQRSYALNQHTAMNLWGNATRVPATIVRLAGCATSHYP